MHSLVLIVFYALIPCALGLILASLIAHSRVRGATFFRAVLFLPQTIATVVVAIAWVWIYAPHGPLNEALRAVGLGGITRGWLGDFDFALPALGLVGTLGRCSASASCCSSPASRRSRHRSTRRRASTAPGACASSSPSRCPGLRGELAVALTLTTIIALRTFDLIYVSTSGGPGTSTTVPAVLVYQNAFTQRARRPRGRGRRRADRAHLRGRLRHHAHRRPGPDAMTATAASSCSATPSSGVFASLAIYPILTIVLLAFHERATW